MEFSTYRISLDVQETSSQAMLSVKKGDSARKLCISLTEGGRPYNISEECTAKLRAKSNNDNKFIDCNIKNNIIEYSFDKDGICADIGIVECEITLYGVNGLQITSARFSLMVEDVVVPDAEIESTNEFSALTNAIAAVENIDISVSKSGTQTKISTTNKDGIVTEVFVNDGAEGEKGETGAQGPQGEKGEQGEAGYTPQKGVDYYTPSEIEEIKNEIGNGFESSSNKLTSSENVTDPNEQYPSFSALDEFVQEALSRFQEEGHISELITEAIILENLETANHKLKTINEQELEGDDEHTLYPSAKAVVAYVAKANAGKEDISNKIDDMSNVDLSGLPDAYPSAQAVGQALFELEERIGRYIADYNPNPESVDNKLTHIDEEFVLDDDNHIYYPSAKGMVLYVNNKIGDIETALDGIIALQNSLIGGEAV